MQKSSTMEHAYETLTTNEVRRLKHLAAFFLEDTIEWRRHGIGCLQGYVSEGANYEQRIHVWHPELMLPGIDISGNAHNHRFDLISTVLCGSLGNEIWHETADEAGEFETWDFVHARLHTEKTRADMERTGHRYRVNKFKTVHIAGQRYYFPRGAFHASSCEGGVTVTLVEKLNQLEEKAMVIAPVTIPPVPAFSGDKVPARLQKAILREAVALLRS